MDEKIREEDVSEVAAGFEEGTDLLRERKGWITGRDWIDGGVPGNKR